MSDLAAFADAFPLPPLPGGRPPGAARLGAAHPGSRPTAATPWPILTEDGWDKVVATAPGHVEEVRASVFDPMTKAQQRQLNTIGRRIMGAIDPDGCCPTPAQRTLRAAVSRRQEG